MTNFRRKKTALRRRFLVAGFGEAKACASLVDTLTFAEGMQVCFLMQASKPLSAHQDMTCQISRENMLNRLIQLV